MFKSETGAHSIEKQDLSCHIRHVECYYPDGKAILYDHGWQNTSPIETNSRAIKSSKNKYTLIGNISFLDFPEYYFITNNKGIGITLKCDRIANYCTMTEHHLYLVTNIDINTKERQQTIKDISDGTLKLYYYNLFSRTIEYAKTGENNGRDLGFVGTYAGRIGGAHVGNIADIIASLRFIHLPKISSEDYKCQTQLQYNECIHNIRIPEITINTYPDIQFSLEIGFMGIENNYSANNKSKDTRKSVNFRTKFSVTYASETKELSFENINETELDTEQQKGVFFYKTINALAEFFKDAANFAEKLQENISSAYPPKSNLAKDTKIIGKTLNKASTLPQWISGSININPSLKASWHYSVNDKLTQLGRNIKIEWGVACNGKLTIDLILLSMALGIKATKKIKIATTAAVAITTIASGGLAGVPAVLIKILVDTMLQGLIEWLANEFGKGKMPIYCNLNIIGNINSKAYSLEWDTSRKIFDEKTKEIEITPKLELEIGLKIKTSITLFVTLNHEIAASANANTSITWKIGQSIKDGNLGTDNNISINPLSVKVDYKVESGFTKEKISGKESQKNTIFVWESPEIKMEPIRWNWFKLYEAPSDTKE
jgi:hypothetical protein